MHRSSSPARLAIVAALTIAVTLATLTTTTATASTDDTGVDPATGASVSTPPDGAVELLVDGSASLPAGVWPDGSPELPFPTVNWAVAASKQYRQAGYPVHVIVAPGTYRETVNVPWQGDDPPPLVIESDVPGAAVISGADVERDWTPVEGTELVSSPWNETWGLAPVPDGWDSVNVSDAVRRREAVFIDGAPLVQVLTEAELVPNSFVVDEAAGRLTVHPPEGVTDVDEHLVEVARRARALHVKGYARAVAVKGFVFESAAAPFEQHMVYISDSENVLIEGNVFRHSSWGGLGICCAGRITVRGNQSIENGGNGIDTYKTRDAVIEDNLVAANNVRGARNGYVGWSAAGSKNLLLHGAVFRNNTYVDNLARGLWFDTDVKHVLVDGDRSCRNLRDGLFIEAVQGPLTITDSTFCDNGRAGIIVGTSGAVTLQRSTLSNNPYGQLVFSGDRFRTWTDHVLGTVIEMGDFADWTIADNELISAGSAPLIYSPVIPLADWTQLLSDGEIVARGNTWTRPSMDGAIRIQASNYPMADWNAMTGDGEAVEPEPTTTTTTTTATTTTTTTTSTTSTTTTTAPAKDKPVKGGGGASGKKIR